MNLILIGPQGCGKGTQAQLIVDKFHFHHVEAGKLIRNAAAQHTHKATIIDHLANQKGQLLPDGVVLDLIQDLLETTGYDDLLFDGFPRTPNQYEAIKEILRQNHQVIDKMLYLHISDESAISRLASRRLCQQCHKTYSLDLDPNRTACDCGGQLAQRPDDQPAAISKRLEIFHQQTQSILELAKLDQILVEINGEQSIDAIFMDISHHL